MLLKIYLSHRLFRVNDIVCRRRHCRFHSPKKARKWKCFIYSKNLEFRYATRRTSSHRLINFFLTSRCATSSIRFGCFVIFSAFSFSLIFIYVSICWDLDCVAVVNALRLPKSSHLTRSTDSNNWFKLLIYWLGSVGVLVLWSAFSADKSENCIYAVELDKWTSDFSFSSHRMKKTRPIRIPNQLSGDEIREWTTTITSPIKCARKIAMEFTPKALFHTQSIEYEVRNIWNCIVPMHTYTAHSRTTGFVAHTVLFISHWTPAKWINNRYRHFICRRRMNKTEREMLSPSRTSTTNQKRKTRQNTTQADKRKKERKSNTVPARWVRIFVGAKNTLLYNIVCRVDCKLWMASGRIAL